MYEYDSYGNFNQLLRGRCFCFIPPAITVNDRSTRTWLPISSNEHISHIVLVFLLLTLSEIVKEKITKILPISLHNL